MDEVDVKGSVARVLKKMHTATKLTIKQGSSNKGILLQGAYITVTKGMSSETWFLGVDENDKFTFHYVGHGDGSF